MGFGQKSVEGMILRITGYIVLLRKIRNETGIYLQKAKHVQNYSHRIQDKILIEINPHLAGPNRSKYALTCL